VESRGDEPETRRAKTNIINQHSIYNTGFTLHIKGNKNCGVDVSNLHALAVLSQTVNKNNINAHSPQHSFCCAHQTHSYLFNTNQLTYAPHLSTTNRPVPGDSCLQNANNERGNMDADVVQRCFADVISR
jgi:hypothetical protein